MVEVVKLETITDATIPSNRTRKKLGVGEKVALTLKGASGSQVAWSKSGPGEISDYSGVSTKFTAYEKGIGASVMAAYKGKTFTANFTVVEPKSESAVKLGEDTFPAGTQGAGMRLEITTSPTYVSFENVEVREVAGPATDIYGYFTNFPTELLTHKSKLWAKIAPGNVTDDYPSLSGWDDKPWYAGGFQWIIPIEWRVVGSANIGTLPNEVQTFSMTDTNGTTTINKLGESVTRSP